MIAMVPLALIPGSRDEFMAGAGFAGVPFGSYLILIALFSIIAFFMYLLIVFIDGILTHIGVLVAGGKQPIGKTIQAVMFSYIPAFILPIFLVYAVIFIVLLLPATLSGPALDFFIIFAILAMAIIFIWMFIIRIIAIHEFQEITTARAVFAAVFIIIVIGLLFGLIFGIGALVHSPDKSERPDRLSADGVIFGGDPSLGVNVELFGAGDMTKNIRIEREMSRSYPDKASFASPVVSVHYDGDFQSAQIEMHYDPGISFRYESLQIYHINETTGTFTRMYCSVNLIDHTVSGMSKELGSFVVMPLKQ